VEGRLALRYARLDPSRLLEARPGHRALLRLEPLQLIAWRGLLRPAQAATPDLRSANSRPAQAATPELRSANSRPAPAAAPDLRSASSR
jgi:hypothetical protein